MPSAERLIHMTPEQLERVRATERRSRARHGEKWNANRREADRLRKESAATRPRPGACEVCGTVGARGVVYDHCHKTEMFRGWLCDRCNRALGLLKDDANLCLQLGLYLERHESGRLPIEGGGGHIGQKGSS